MEQLHMEFLHYRHIRWGPHNPWASCYFRSMDGQIAMDSIQGLWFILINIIYFLRFRFLQGTNTSNKAVSSNFTISDVHNHNKTGWTWVSVYPRSTIQDPIYISLCKNFLLAAANYLLYCNFWTKTCKTDMLWLKLGVTSVQTLPLYWLCVHLHLWEFHALWLCLSQVRQLYFYW